MKLVSSKHFECASRRVRYTLRGMPLHWLKSIHNRRTSRPKPYMLPYAPKWRLFYLRIKQSQAIVSDDQTAATDLHRRSGEQALNRLPCISHGSDFDVAAAKPSCSISPVLPGNVTNVRRDTYI